MKDNSQSNHFKKEENRYKEELILNPPQHTKEEINTIIQYLIKHKINEVIEFGSGNGRLTIPLLQNTIQVNAVDISKESLGSLAELAFKLNLNTKLLSTALTLPKGKHDAIVGCDILHHVDLDYYLSEMKSTLKPGHGRIIFSEPNILNIAWPLLITFAIDWRIEWRIVFCNYVTLMKKLKEAGFRNIKIKGHGLLPPPLFNSFSVLQKINYFLGDLPILKLFAYRYIIMASL